MPVLKFNFLLAIKIMSKNLNGILLILITSFCMNACGTKGPLYIPEKQYPQETPAKQ